MVLPRPKVLLLLPPLRNYHYDYKHDDGDEDDDEHDDHDDDEEATSASVCKWHMDGLPATSQHRLLRRMLCLLNGFDPLHVPLCCCCQHPVGLLAFHWQVLLLLLCAAPAGTLRSWSTGRSASAGQQRPELGDVGIGGASGAQQ